MFTLISGLPPYTVGIIARGDVTADDYKEVLEPALKKVSAEWKGINLLFVLETSVKNFTAGAWLQDVKINMQYFLKWNKLAMVDHSPVLEAITTAFDFIAPGEVRTFHNPQLEEAKKWVSSP